MAVLSFFAVSVEVDPDLPEVERRVDVCVGINDVERRLTDSVVGIDRQSFVQFIKSLIVQFARSWPFV